jgi:hypothetical protein
MRPGYETPTVTLSSFKYEFEAKLDVGAFRPAIRITDADEISLQPAAASGDSRIT